MSTSLAPSKVLQWQAPLYFIAPEPSHSIANSDLLLQRVPRNQRKELSPEAFQRLNTLLESLKGIYEAQITGCHEESTLKFSISLIPFFAKLVDRYRSSGIAIYALYLKGSFARHALFDSKEFFSDIDFTLMLDQPLNYALCQRLFFECLEEEAKIKREVFEDYIQFFQEGGEFSFKIPLEKNREHFLFPSPFFHGGLKQLYLSKTEEESYLQFRLPIRPKTVDLSIDYHRHHSCVSSADSFCIDVLPLLFYQGNEIYAKAPSVWAITTDGYLYHDAERFLVEEGSFEVQPRTPFPTIRDGILRYTKLLTKGFVPVNLNIERGFVEGYIKQYSASMERWKEAIKKMLEEHCGERIDQRLLMLINLGEILERAEPSSSCSKAQEFVYQLFEEEIAGRYDAFPSYEDFRALLFCLMVASDEKDIWHFPQEKNPFSFYRFTTNNKAYLFARFSFFPLFTFLKIFYSKKISEKSYQNFRSLFCEEKGLLFLDATREEMSPTQLSKQILPKISCFLSSLSRRGLQAEREKIEFLRLVLSQSPSLSFSRMVHGIRALVAAKDFEERRQICDLLSTSCAIALKELKKNLAGEETALYCAAIVDLLLAEEAVFYDVAFFLQDALLKEDRTFLPKLKGMLQEKNIASVHLKKLYESFKLFAKTQQDFTLSLEAFCYFFPGFSKLGGNALYREEMIHLLEEKEHRKIILNQEMARLIGNHFYPLILSLINEESAQAFLIFERVERDSSILTSAQRSDLIEQFLGQFLSSKNPKEFERGQLLLRKALLTKETMHESVARVLEKALCEVEIASQFKELLFLLREFSQKNEDSSAVYYSVVKQAGDRAAAHFSSTLEEIWAIYVAIGERNPEHPYKELATGFIAQVAVLKGAQAFKICHNVFAHPESYPYVTVSSQTLFLFLQMLLSQQKTEEARVFYFERESLALKGDLSGFIPVFYTLFDHLGTSMQSNGCEKILSEGDNEKFFRLFVQKIQMNETLKLKPKLLNNFLTIFRKLSESNLKALNHYSGKFNYLIQSACLSIDILQGEATDQYQILIEEKEKIALKQKMEKNVIFLVKKICDRFCEKTKHRQSRDACIEFAAFYPALKGILCLPNRPKLTKKFLEHGITALRYAVDARLATLDIVLDAYVAIDTACSHNWVNGTISAEVALLIALEAHCKEDLHFFKFRPIVAIISKHLLDAMQASNDPKAILRLEEIGNSFFSFQRTYLKNYEAFLDHLPIAAFLFSQMVVDNLKILRIGGIKGKIAKGEEPLIEIGRATQLLKIFATSMCSAAHHNAAFIEVATLMLASKITRRDVVAFYKEFGTYLAVDDYHQLIYLMVQQYLEDGDLHLLKTSLVLETVYVGNNPAVHNPVFVFYDLALIFTQAAAKICAGEITEKEMEMGIQCLNLLTIYSPTDEALYGSKNREGIEAIFCIASVKEKIEGYIEKVCCAALVLKQPGTKKALEEQLSKIANNPLFAEYAKIAECLKRLRDE